MMLWVKTAILLPGAIALEASTLPPQYPDFCKPGDDCWPSATELEALSDALNPEQVRDLTWPGGDSPRTSAVPYGSPGNQPLFGMTANLKPVYVAEAGAKPNCYSGKLGNEFCKQSTRNLPKAGWQPSIIAWPLNQEHVQTLLAFATLHNLCVSVAGTGHDYVNRHTCHQGIFIRMSLFKNIEWDLSDKFGWADGSVKLGAGIVLSEAHESGARQSPPRFIASGWAQTVGVVGWSIGGGHGPFGVSKGFGADNLLEVELVLANGTLATAMPKKTLICFGHCVEAVALPGVLSLLSLSEPMHLLLVASQKSI
jgi:ribonuclease T2